MATQKRRGNDGNLGKILKSRRTELGMTLANLGELAGIHVSHLGRIEKGQRFPSAFILRKLAKPLNFGEMELFKIAGFLPSDETDDRIAKMKQTMQSEILKAMTNLIGKIDELR